MRIEYHVEGADSLMIRVRASGQEIRDDIIDAIGDAQQAAHTELKLRVPFKSGELFNSIEAGPVVFRPGAAGGGGFYEAELSVGAGVEHMRYVTEGTGDLGPRASGPIRPKKGNVLKIQKEGESVRFRPEAKGQAANDDWLEAAAAVANSIIEQKISRI